MFRRLVGGGKKEQANPQPVAPTPQQNAPPVATSPTAATSSSRTASPPRSHKKKEKKEKKAPEPEPPPVELSEEELAKQQRRQARKILTNFVKQMVPGKKMSLMMPNGKLKSCGLSISRKLDAIRLRIGSEERRLELVELAKIDVGTEVEVATPVDDLCATLVMSDDRAVSIRFSDIEERDTFVMCILMFCQKLQGEDDYDYEYEEEG